jgi:subtilase family serine protease
LGNPALTQVSPRIRVTVDSGNSVVESLENNNQTVHVCNL